MLTARLDGVRQMMVGQRLEWRYHGRLVARQVDESHVVIRAEFAYRDAMLKAFPKTFSVPTRFRKHMMIVANLDRGDRDAIGDAIEMAYELQRTGA